MGINSLEVEITRTVLNRFLNLQQPTPRKDLVVKFKDPEAIDKLVTKSLLNRIDIAGKTLFAPKLLAFHYCADPEVVRKAKTGVEIILHVLKNLFEIEEENKQIGRREIEAHTAKMYDKVDPEELKLGLYLIREFNVLRSYGTNAESLEINSLTIDESIVTLKDISQEWDHRIWILNRYIEHEPLSLDMNQSVAVSLPSSVGNDFNWPAYPIIQPDAAKEPLDPLRKYRVHSFLIHGIAWSTDNG